VSTSSLSRLLTHPGQPALKNTNSSYNTCSMCGCSGPRKRGRYRIDNGRGGSLLAVRARHSATSGAAAGQRQGQAACHRAIQLGGSSDSSIKQLSEQQQQHSKRSPGPAAHTPAEQARGPGHSDSVGSPGGVWLGRGAGHARQGNVHHGQSGRGTVSSLPLPSTLT